MFPEVGATELMVIAAVALIVVGPKDLPVLLRKVGQFTAKMRGMAAEFRSSFDEMARQSELDELRREVQALRSGDYLADTSGAATSVLDEIDHDLAANEAMWAQPEPEMTPGEPAPEPAASPAPKKPRAKPAAKAAPKASAARAAPARKPAARKKPASVTEAKP